MLNKEIDLNKIISLNKASLLTILFAVLVLWFYVLRVPTYNGFDTFNDVLTIALGVPVFLGGALLFFLLIKILLDNFFRKEVNGFWVALPISLCLLAWGLFFTDEGLTRQAIISKNAVYCEKVKYDEYKNECFMTMAGIIKGDGEKLCGMISDKGFFLRNNCYIKAAKNLNDPRLCEKIVKYEAMKKECYSKNITVKTVGENSKQNANDNDAALKADDARITDQINNGEYYSSNTKSKIILKDGSFYIEPDIAKTSFGIYFSVEKYAIGDLNNDGNDDAAVILKSFNEGGSVPVYDLNILINQEEELVWRASKYFQYGTQIKSINIGNREIIIDTIIPGSNEMPCCPTVEKTFRYQLIDGNITESNNLGDNLCDRRDGIWKNYESKEIGVSFKYPADCTFMGDYSDWGRITWFNCKQFHISIASKNYHPYIIDYANNQPISPDWTTQEFIANMEVEKSGYGQNEILFIKKLSSKSLLVAEYALGEGSSYLRLFVLSPLNKNYPNLKVDINYPFEEDKSVKEYVESAKLQGRDYFVPQGLYDDVAQKILAGTYSEELGCLIDDALQIADSSELINN